MKALRIRRLSLREVLTIGLPALVLAGAAFWLASAFIKPAPPDKIVISTGGEGGAYHAFAEQYAEILARDGITLELRTSAGSVENLKRLQDPAGDVEIAFVQGGIKPENLAEDAPALVKLASVAYEPLWVFVRGKAPVDHLTQLKGKKLAVGPEGSGTRSLVQLLVKANGLDDSSTMLLPLGGREAVAALEKGAIDAAFFVAAPDGAIVKELVHRKDLQLANFATADAYVRRYPFLTRLTLPQGSISFIENLPPRDITLLSPTARLIAREDAHPALVYLILQAATEVHREAGLLQKAGEFPYLRPGDYELSQEAERYFKQGVPFLQRLFPFWLAVLIERMWVLILPLIAIVVPLMKIVPPLYAWRVKSKFFRRYGELRYIEAEVDRTEGREALQAMLDRVGKLDDEVRAIAVPLAFSELLYTFRGHVDMVRAKISARLRQG
ncbi:MAG: TAXI family TRAP transporter solute-binding subunit [Betaproteobacteria bacterium]|nr:TAXI family TRAP transporter solute-binding subunit [Betaproteobacteria bacterium]